MSMKMGTWNAFVPYMDTATLHAPCIPPRTNRFVVVMKYTVGVGVGKELEVPWCRVCAVQEIQSSGTPSCTESPLPRGLA